MGDRRSLVYVSLHPGIWLTPTPMESTSVHTPPSQGLRYNTISFLASSVSVEEMRSQNSPYGLNMSMRNFSPKGQFSRNI